MRVGRSIIAAIASHAALTTGVHGAGSDTLATDQDIATHVAIATAHQDAPDLILTHKGDASAHHVKYLDADALAAALAGGLNKIVWLADQSAALSDLNRTSTLDWTALDLTAALSAAAKFAILRLEQKCDSYTSGDVTVELRKKGETPTYTVLLSPATMHVTARPSMVVVIIGLDSGQEIEYKILVSATAQVDTHIYPLGYIE